MYLTDNDDKILSNLLSARFDLFGELDIIECREDMTDSDKRDEIEKYHTLVKSLNNVMSEIWLTNYPEHHERIKDSDWAKLWPGHEVA